MAPSNLCQLATGGRPQEVLHPGRVQPAIGRLGRFILPLCRTPPHAHPCSFEPRLCRLGLCLQVATVVHYESTQYSRWKDKFSDFAQRARHGIPDHVAAQFTPFYRTSIEVCKQFLDSYHASAATMQLMSHVTCEGVGADAEGFWRDHKTEPSDLVAELSASELQSDRDPADSPRAPSVGHNITALPERGLTMMPPAARSVCTASDVLAGSRIQVTLPRCHRWRVACKFVYVRDAPGTKVGRMLTAFPQGAELTANGQVELSPAEQWLRIDGTADR